MRNKNQNTVVRLTSPTHLLLLSSVLLLSPSCKQVVKEPTTNVSVESQISKVSVTSVDVQNNQLIVKGNNLNIVKKVWIKDSDSTSNNDFKIVSASANQLIASGVKNIAFVLNTAGQKVVDLFLSDAYGQVTYTVSFVLQNNSVDGAVKIKQNSITLDRLSPEFSTGGLSATAGQFLKYTASGWIPSYLTEVQTYLGDWDATTSLPVVDATAGNYYIVSKANTTSSPPYAVGDWIVSNGSTWDKIPYSVRNAVSTFNKRSGNVTLVPADYSYLKKNGKITSSSINDLADITITTPASGQYLKYNGTSWINYDLSGDYQAKGNYITAVSGTDITATTTGTSVNVVVKSIGGVLPDANATASTLVKRDTNGAISVAGLTSSGAVSITSGGLSVTGGITGSLAASSLTGQVPVANGGTGVSTLTTNAILVGNGTGTISTITNTPLSPGVLIYDGVNKPAFSSAATGGLFVQKTAASIPGFVNGTGVVHSIQGNDPTFIAGTGYLYSANAAAAPSYVSGTSSQFMKGNGTAATIATSDLPALTSTMLPSDVVYANATTINYIPYVSATASKQTITNSPIAVSGSNISLANGSSVGIGRTPLAQLDVYNSSVGGNILVAGPSSAGGRIEFSNGGTGLGNHLLGYSGSSLDLFVQAASSTNAIFNIGNSEKMRITSAGKVGIGNTSPTYDLDVTGDINASSKVRAAGVILTSDARFKKDIEIIENPLSKILKLNGVTYNWRQDEFPQRHFNDQHQIGVIAQNIEKVFPEAVDTARDGYKAVNYPVLVAPIIEAIKEFYRNWFFDSKNTHNEISQLKAENSLLKAKTQQIEKENAELKVRMERIENSIRVK